MTDNIFEEELETQSNAGRSQILAAGFCLALSLMCGLLWVFILLWPQLLKSFA